MDPNGSERCRNRRNKAVGDRDPPIRKALERQQLEPLRWIFSVTAAISTLDESDLYPPVPELRYPID